MVADDQVALVCPEHGRGHIAFVCVEINAFELAVFVGVGYGAQAVLVDQPVLQLAVLLFAYAPVERVDQVFDLRAIGQGDQAQVAQAVVGVAGGALRRGFFLQVTGFAVGVGVVFPLQQPVLVVVAGDELAVFMRAVAVGVVAPFGALPGPLVFLLRVPGQPLAPSYS